ncbi:PAS domain S-box protein [Paraburkholderia sp. J8-2]|uniref:PAS domain S-box protein n=1 Tax=Paraburkholderia sp. J8-2 TaxID=2805440 RepID=UPI002AB712E9|nr:PAS domain S-box protein [Paraburkholderia sp. J8-2]
MLQTPLQAPLQALSRLRFPRSLHAQLVLSLLVLCTLVAGTSAFFLLEHARERRIAELDDRANRIADLLSQSLAQPLWNVDREAIARQLNVLKPNPEVVSFTVTAINYGVLADASNAPMPDPRARVVRVRPIEFTPPGNAPPEKIGEVRVVLTRAAADRGFATARAAVLGTLALVLAVVYATTFLLIKHLVREPIRRLEDMVDRIASGDLDSRCAIESSAELGRLAARVNVMAERLSDSTASLRESERKYRSIIEHSLEGFFVLDRHGKLRDANPAMAQLLGYRDVQGMKAALGDNACAVHAPSSFSGENTTQLFAMLQIAGKIAGMEIELTRADGTTVWCQLNARGIRYDGAGPQCLEGQLTDISGRKHAMEILTRHRDQLEEEVRERTRTEQLLRHSREQLRQLSSHQESIREEERRQIAMTIHDELGQLLTAIKINVALLKLALSQGAEWKQKVGDIGSLAERTIDIVRNVASHLRPAALNFGLLSALEWLVQDFTRHNATVCTFRLEGREPSVSDDRATAVFRIVQEALTNVSRHAQASRAEVVLRCTHHHFELEVHDDGNGFDVANAIRGNSYGLQGMQERARMIGAQFHIESRDGTGSRVRIVFSETQDVVSRDLPADNELR